MTSLAIKSRIASLFLHFCWREHAGKIVEIKASTSLVAPVVSLMSTEGDSSKKDWMKWYVIPSGMSIALPRGEQKAGSEEDAIQGCRKARMTDFE